VYTAMYNTHLVTLWFTGAKSDNADTFLTRLVGGLLEMGDWGNESSSSNMSSAASAPAKA
jgi:hypothetical protein